MSVRSPCDNVRSFVRSRFLWHGYVSKAALRKWDGKKFLTIVTAARYRNESISSRDLCIVFTRSRGWLVGKKKKKKKKWRGDWIINHMRRSKLLDRERKNISRGDIRRGWKCKLVLPRLVVYDLVIFPFHSELVILINNLLHSFVINSVVFLVRKDLINKTNFAREFLGNRGI